MEVWKLAMNLRNRKEHSDDTIFWAAWNCPTVFKHVSKTHLTNVLIQNQWRKFINWTIEQNNSASCSFVDVVYERAYIFSLKSFRGGSAALRYSCKDSCCLLEPRKSVSLTLSVLPVLSPSLTRERQGGMERATTSPSLARASSLFFYFLFFRVSGEGGNEEGGWLVFQLTKVGLVERQLQQLRISRIWNISLIENRIAS